MSNATTNCPCCDAENEPMGQLGAKMHYRCRDCGVVYNGPAQPEGWLVLTEEMEA